MRTGILTAVVPLSLLLAAVAATTPPNAVAGDASDAIETVQHRCSPVAASPTDPPSTQPTKLDCVAIYRNTSDEPALGIIIRALIAGRPAESTTWHRACCVRGSRQSLAPGASAVWKATLIVPDRVAVDAPVSFAYVVSGDADASELDVPKPELQYVDREQRGSLVGYVGEVRNVDARQWNTDPEDSEVPRTAPIIALFRRGKLVGAAEAPRVPTRRIDVNGRYVFKADVMDAGLDIDAVQVFYRDTFASAYGAGYSAGRWELTGLDHHIETDAAGRQRMLFRIAVRNPTDQANRGRVSVIVRRADFHAVGYGKCEMPEDVEPGAEASCSGEVQLFSQRFDATLDDVKIVTAELGVAIARFRTPTPTFTATPCPALATPAPVPTLPSVARALFFPWSIRMLAERCP
ncbi:MAG: hypothetical protein IT332_11865 [Ardenticatenales bacterium]|nr:hypothetical protein [Ardenticatenales bacterium]